MGLRNFMKLAEMCKTVVGARSLLLLPYSTSGKNVLCVCVSRHIKMLLTSKIAWQDQSELKVVPPF